VRVQLENDTVRIRIDEDELAAVLGGAVLKGSTCFGTVFLMRYSLQADAGGHCSVEGRANAWRVKVPTTDLAGLKSRLPSKEGLVFDLRENGQVTTTVRVDVDVKDSLRRRRERVPREAG
jgi:hypothetical protein